MASNLIAKSELAFNVIRHMWHDRIRLIARFCVIAIISVLFVLLLPNKYRSTAVLLPDANQATLQGIAGLASLAGIQLGGESGWIDLFPRIIISHNVLAPVIFKKYSSKEFNDHVNLVEYWGYTSEDSLRSYDKTFEALRKALEVSYDRLTRVVSISLIQKDSRVGAEIVNNILISLDEFLKTKRVTTAGQRREWIESRLGEVSSTMIEVEDSLRKFREKNRRVIDSPALLLEQNRLVREVEMQSQIYLELNKQLEIAKIDEVNLLPIVNILDTARQTTIKESPRRAIIVVGVMFITLLFSVIYYFVVATNPNEINELIKQIQGLLSK